MRAVEGLCVLALACGGGLGCARRTAAPAASHAAPATVAHRVEAAALTRVTLTAEAASRLGVEEVVVAAGAVADVRELGGEVVAPPGRALTLTVPVAGTIARGAGLEAGARVTRGALLAGLVPMAPTDRDLRAQAEQGVAVALARVEAAEARATRAESLASAQAGSVRASEEARAEREVARAALVAARARRARLVSSPLASDVVLAVRAPYDGVVRQVFAAEGQSLAAGAPLLELVALDPLWVRVPVYAGDFASVDARAAVRVSALSAPASEPGVRAEPVAAPPTADTTAITRDLYYALPNADGQWAPGVRVRVQLSLRSRGGALTLPASAVVWDNHGGAWVYATTGAYTYTRRRVEVDRIEDATAVLLRGVVAGDRVVTTGAAELFGVEFGAGH
jgi:cobalt-zinc-cadmium efflux system membrane fusion protein